MTTGEVIALIKALGGNGGGSGGRVLVVTDTDGTLDKTWAEIATAMANNGAVLVWTNRAGELASIDVFVQAMHGLSGNVLVTTSAGDMYTADSESGYPTMGD